MTEGAPAMPRTTTALGRRRSQLPIAPDRAPAELPTPRSPLRAEVATPDEGGQRDDTGQSHEAQPGEAQPGDTRSRDSGQPDEARSGDTRSRDAGRRPIPGRGSFPGLARAACSATVATAAVAVALTAAADSGSAGRPATAQVHMLAAHVPSQVPPALRPTLPVPSVPAQVPAPIPALAPPAPAMPAPSVGSIALAAARTVMGRPYVWGAAGPRGFDCSGLMLWSFQHAGVRLPHSSSSQSMIGRPVSRAELQPGDLVFFYSPISHVGMYLGNGRMVHAPNPSRRVEVASIDSMPYAGAVRP
jgi:cell wall-associated NlpC family hydrolase